MMIVMRSKRFKFANLTFCLSVCLFVSLSVCLAICLSVLVLDGGDVLVVLQWTFPSVMMTTMMMQTCLVEMY